MDEDERDWEPDEPSDLGFDPYAGDYVDTFYEDMDPGEWIGLDDEYDPFED